MSDPRETFLQSTGVGQAKTKRRFNIRANIIAYLHSLALNADRLNWYEVRFHDVECYISHSFARTQHFHLCRNTRSLLH